MDRVLRVTVVAVLITLGVACSGSEPAIETSAPVGEGVAGTYHCGSEGEDPHDVLELREDGTLTFTFGALPGAPAGAPPPEEGTWSVDGDSGVLDFTVYEDRIAVEAGTLRFAHAGSPETTVCTPAS